jgi:hypothetical protein
MVAGNGRGGQTDEATSAREQLKARGPAYVTSVLSDAAELQEFGSLRRVRPDQIAVLGGGVDAVTYLVQSADQRVVVKLNDRSLEAEAEALRAWASYTPRAPEVLAMGVVPSTAADENPVKYLLLTALTDDDGRIGLSRSVPLQRPAAGARIGH